MNKSQIIYLPFKRLIDFIGSVIGIIVCIILLWWWVLLINIIATKGHPFFVSHRIGKSGKKFRCLKFRSMRLDADPYMTSREERSVLAVTGFGRFLRKTSIDETLQLFNVLIGQMAFIGPRPLIDIGEDAITISKRKENNSIKIRPGISGYAQINGREEIDPIQKSEMDGYYYEHFNLWMDIKIFFKTIFKMFGEKK